MRTIGEFNLDIRELIIIRSALEIMVSCANDDESDIEDETVFEIEDLADKISNKVEEIRKTVQLGEH